MNINGGCQPPRPSTALTNDGTNTYSWDARNHLTTIVGPNTASFVYDADGRRAQKTIGSTSTQFLYDGLNPVQEIQNGAPSANLLTGLGSLHSISSVQTSPPLGSPDHERINRRKLGH